MLQKTFLGVATSWDFNIDRKMYVVTGISSFTCFCACFYLRRGLKSSAIMQYYCLYLIV